MASALAAGSRPRRGTLIADKSGAWADLALTLPVFLAYQLGVVFLNVRDGSDMVTARLLALAHGDRSLYFELTAAMGAAMVAVFAVLGRGQALSVRKLFQIAFEGAVYALVMGVVTSWVVGKVFASTGASAVPGRLAGLVLSLGAGFYEELAFRVIMFGLGTKILQWLLIRRRTNGALGAGGFRSGSAVVLWAVVCAAAFSGMHYIGSLGDAFDARSFVARMVLGLALTTVYATRGFAAAVWTHALYDVWVLVI